MSFNKGFLWSKPPSPHPKQKTNKHLSEPVSAVQHLCSGPPHAEWLSPSILLGNGHLLVLLPQFLRKLLTWKNIRQMLPVQVVELGEGCSGCRACREAPGGLGILYVIVPTASLIPILVSFEMM